MNIGAQWAKRLGMPRNVVLTWAVALSERRRCATKPYRIILSVLLAWQPGVFLSFEILWSEEVSSG